MLPFKILSVTKKKERKIKSKTVNNSVQEPEITCVMDPFVDTCSLSLVLLT